MAEDQQPTTPTTSTTPAKPRQSMIRLALPVILLGATMLIVQLVGGDAKDETGEGTPTPPAKTQSQPEWESSSAPQPVSPRDGAIFVDSAQTLTWKWSPGLAENQQFVVHVWYGVETPREVWTVESSLDAAEAVDSFVQDTGQFYWQVAVITVNADGSFASMASEWSPVQRLERVRHISPPPLPVEQRSAAAQAIMAGEPPSIEATIDAVRVYIFSHSDHSAQHSFAPDYSDALAMMVAYDAGEGEKPRLMCDGQATSALTLLLELGIDSRLIFLYTDISDSVQEHTILEVFNSDSQRWELHDVYSNRYFVDENRNRTTIERLVFGPLETVSVCDADHACAPFLDSDYGFPNHFEAFRYGYTDTFWVNPDRFDMSKRFPSNGDRNLAEYLTDNPRDFVFRFDSWR